MAEDRVFFSRLLTKSLHISKDSSERYFEGILTVEMVDKQNEITVVDELLRVLPIWMDRGGPITDQHSNRIIGKGINFARTVIKDADGTEYPAITITGKIYKHYTLDDHIWAQIKNGNYKGLSFGGATKSDRTPVIQSDGNIAYSLKDLEHYEVAVCPEPACPLALIVDINPLAKSIMGDRMVNRGDGKSVIRCTKVGCFIDKQHDNPTGGNTIGAVKDPDEKEDQSPGPDYAGTGKTHTDDTGGRQVIPPAEHIVNTPKDEHEDDLEKMLRMITKPFAGYKDFAACVAANSDKGDPNAYCGKIYHEVEGKSKNVGPTLEATGHQDGKPEAYIDPQVVGVEDEEKSKADWNQIGGSIRTGEGYDTFTQGPEKNNQITEETEDKKKIYIKTDINNSIGMTDEIKPSETKKVEPVVKADEPKVEEKKPEDETKATLKAILDAVASLQTEVKAIKEKAMETPTDLPIKPANSADEDIGAKVKVPDTYQSNSVQAGITDSSPGRPPQKDPGELSMQVKSAENVTKTSTPRAVAPVETIERVQGSTREPSPILADARKVGFEGLSSVAKSILNGKYYTPQEYEVA